MIIITVLMFVAAILGGLPLTTKAPELLMLSRVFVGLHSGQSRDTQYTARCLYYVCVGYCVYVNHLLCCHVALVFAVMRLYNIKKKFLLLLSIPRLYF